MDGMRLIFFQSLFVTAVAIDSIYDLNCFITADTDNSYSATFLKPFWNSI